MRGTLPPGWWAVDRSRPVLDRLLRSPPMGPLHDLRVVELEAVGPVPLAGMLLGDLGAEVVRVDRPGGRRHAADT